MEEDLDALVRRVDADRWLASRFAADPAARKTMIAVYALNYELARVGETVSQPMVGDIRLAWWLEGIEALFEGGEPRAHPVLQALAGPVRAGALSRDLLEALVEARHADLEPAPFPDEAALTAYIDGTAGAVMALAAQALDPRATPEMTRAAARAWGWAGLLRATAFWTARGRSWRPNDWADRQDAEVAGYARDRVKEGLDLARRQLPKLPVAAFPAVAYATLALPYIRRSEVSELVKRMQLTAAAAKGNI
jgi:phytoene synthase